ncbi:hypothetical protein [Acinetobacter seifertii]|uniref:hypothetical protein n=1 Tax=Acinetobacter seifertii TaxID=1530123 RepID=UPI0040427101
MRLIVHRQSGFNTGNEKGYVIPIAHENDDSTIRPLQPDEFPNNNRIWISRGYTLIEDEFGSEDIFYLNTYHDTCEKKDDSRQEVERIERELADIRNNPNICQYFSLGGNASRLDSGYIQLVQLPSLPDVGTGRLTSNLMPKLPAVGIPFFVTVDEYVYGPFQIRRDTTIGIEDDIIFETVNKITPLGLQNNHIAKFSLKSLEENKILLRINSGNIQATYISNMRVIKSLINFDVIDYISDTNLVQYYLRSDFAKDNSISKNHANTLRLAIETSIRKNQIVKSERIDRLYKVLDKFLNQDTQEYDLIKRYLSSKEGGAFLTNFLETNGSVLLKDHISTLTAKNSKELEELRNTHDAAITALNSRYANDKQAIDRKTAKLQSDFEIHQQELEAQKKAINTSNLSAEAEELRKKINTLSAELQILKRGADLEQQIYRLEGRRDSLDQDVTRRNAQLDDLKNSMQQQARLIQNPSLLSEKAVEIATLRGIMNGGNFQSEQEPFILETLNPAIIHVEGETRISYINEIQHLINKEDERHLSYNETANLIVSVLQNYLTIFSGFPGVGKTSTVNNFAKALGISGTSGNKANFLNVAVARGWTSSKDLLGNKNAIRLNYEEGRTGIYSMLKALENSKNTPENNAVNHEMLSLILLDEANLSPMEHYWSDFLSICDTFHEGKTLNLGGRDKQFTLELPPNLRFVATINTDATVEPLSDRLLDRAGVITIGNEDLTQAESIVDNLIFSGAVPYQELAEAFMIDRKALGGLVESGKLDSELSIIQEIRNVLQLDIVNTPSVHISKRKLLAIESYCAVANELSYHQVSPIDFAVAQHILPKIKGHGKGFKERLLALDKVFSDSRLLQSKRLLKHILDNGSEFADTFSLL